MDNMFGYLGIYGGYELLTEATKAISKDCPQLSQVCKVLFPKMPSMLLAPSKGKIFRPEEFLETLVKTLTSHPQQNSDETDVAMYQLMFTNQKESPSSIADGLFSQHSEVIYKALTQEAQVLAAASYIYTKSLYIPKNTIGVQNDFISIYPNANRRTLTSKVQYFIKPKQKCNHLLQQTIINRNHDKNKNSFIQSLLDFGVIIGLMSSTTQKKNPFIRKIITAPQKRKRGIITDTYSFLQNFRYTPLTMSEAEKIASHSYLKPITYAGFVCAFNHWATERLTLANYLSTVYQWKMDYPLQYQDILPLVEQMTAIPFTKTRLTILDELHTFIKELNQTQAFWSAEKLHQALQHVIVALQRTIQRFTLVTMPLIILSFHFVMNHTPVEGPYFPSLFKKMDAKYIYFEKNMDSTGRQKISLAAAHRDIDDLPEEQKKEFNKIASELYAKFIELTNKNVTDYNFGNTYKITEEKAQQLYTNILQDILLDSLKPKQEYNPLVSPFDDPSFVPI